jgi:mRNA interferase MazF
LETKNGDSSSYVPERGDILWLDFSPQAGHEQAGRRPALTLSPAAYNKLRGMGLFCPITTRTKSWPFELEIPTGNSVHGYALCDQVRNLDWKTRNAIFIQEAPKDLINEALALLEPLVAIED